MRSPHDKLSLAKPETPMSPESFVGCKGSRSEEDTSVPKKPTQHLNSPGMINDADRTLSG